MKVLHIAGQSPSTGAGRGVLWLHQGLVKGSIDSNALFQFGGTNFEKVHTLHSGIVGRVKQSLLSRLEVQPLSKYPNRGSLFSTGKYGNEITKHPLYADSDIIHLHWINRAMLSTKLIGRIKKPVVWTLRDMWPLTGGCHYDRGCNRYHNVCESCPQLDSKDAPDLSTTIQDEKLHHWGSLNLHLVPISTWLEECVTKSKIFKNLTNVTTIPNCIDTEIFKPIDKSFARQSLGLPLNRKIVLCGAQNLESHYKGFGHFLDATESIEKSSLYLFFGRLDEKTVKDKNLEYVNLGHVTDTDKLLSAYSSADVFVAPSLQEAFGKTLIESMACKTPVVCYDSTGPRDIVDHKVTGFKANPLDPRSLADGVNWLLSKGFSDIQKIREKCREKVIESFSTDTVSKQYIDLYEQILREAVTTPTTQLGRRH